MEGIPFAQQKVQEEPEEAGTHHTSPLDSPAHDQRCSTSYIRHGSLRVCACNRKAWAVSDAHHQVLVSLAGAVVRYVLLVWVTFGG